MAYTNPAYFDGPRLLKQKRRAVDGITWQAGQFCRLTDSGVTKVKALGVYVHGIFSQTQAAATSSSDVYIERITSPVTRFIMACSRTSAGSTDCRAATTLISKDKGIAVNACVCTVAINCDTTTGVRVEEVASNLNSLQYPSTGNPGYVIVSVPATVLAST